MNTVRFIKSFSKGQITIPKDIRDTLGMLNEFWLKLYVQDGKIIAEPIEQKPDKSAYVQKLLNINGDWLDPDEVKVNREQIEKQLVKRSL